MRLSTAITVKAIISLTVFFILLSSLLRYFSGLALFSPLYIAISTILLLSLAGKNLRPTRLGVWLLFLMLLGSVIFSLINFSHYQFRGVFYSLAIFISALLGYVLAKDERVDLLLCAKAILMVFFAYFFLCALFIGFSPEKINYYLPNSSRNAVSAIAIFLQVFYSATFYLRKRTFPKITIFITLAICLMCFGRSGIVFGLLLFFLSWAHYFINARKNSFQYVALFVFSIISITALVLALDIPSLLVEQTNFSRSLESPRITMYTGYLFNLNLTDVIFGQSFEGLTAIQAYEGNPHSSLILGHHFMGLPYFLWFALTLLIGGLRMFRGGAAMWLLGLCWLFLGRSALDILSLPGLFDIIFFYIYFSALLTNHNIARKRRFNIKGNRAFNDRDAILQ